MKKIKIVLFSVFFIIFALVACSWLSGPSESDIQRAIETSINFVNGPFKIRLTSPVTLVERGAKKEDGVYPVKIRFSYDHEVTYKNLAYLWPKTHHSLKDYVASCMKEQDNMGKYYWRCTVGIDPNSD